MGEKVGRPKEPSRDELKAGNIVQRVLAMEQAARRSLPYAQRLYHERKLTLTQMAAAAQVARLYGRWAKQNGARFNAKSQSFEFTTAGDDGRGIYITPTDAARQVDADEQARIDEVNKAWARLQTCVPVRPREAWSWVIELCVFENYVPADVLRDVKIILDRVAEEFAIGAEVEDALEAERPGPKKRGDDNTPVFRKAAPWLLKNGKVVELPSIVPALKPTRSKPRLTRAEKLDKSHYAARTDDAKPQRPSRLNGAAKAAAARDREGLMRTLEKRQAQREAAEPVA